MLFHGANAISGDLFRTMALCLAPPSVPGAGAGAGMGVGCPSVCTSGGGLVASQAGACIT